MRKLLFLLLLLVVVALCWWRGRSDERWAASACVVATILSWIVVEIGGRSVGQFSQTLFLVDAGVFAVFVAIALRSTRFWPLWVAAFQLIATVVHLLKMLDPQLMGFVFRTAIVFWSYPILLLIGVGAWRTRTIERWRAQQRLPQAS